MKAHELHRSAAPSTLNFYLVTVSSGRYRRKSMGEQVLDEAGDVAQRLILNSHHSLLGRELVSDDPQMLREALNRALSMDKVDAIIFTGGTGISSKDVTIEVIKPLFEKELEGFGELLRYIGFQKIGPAAILTRATAGVIAKKLVLCLPGSPDAVEMALLNFMNELPHAVFIART